jgi:hypothetical protein
MKQTNLLLLFTIIIAIEGALPAQGDRVYLQSGSHLRFSIETYQTRQGWTPLQVSLDGTEVAAVADGRGRVFASTQNNAPGQVEPLFIIDLLQGTIDLAGTLHKIHVYEQNDVRTRFWIMAETIELPLELQEDGRTGTLYVGGMAIQVRVSADKRGVKSDVLFKEPIIGPVLAEKNQGGIARLIASRIMPRSNKNGGK